MLHLGSLRLKAFFNATCQPKSVSTRRIFFNVLREINNDVAKKTTMELDSVVVRIVLSVFSNRSHPWERTRKESPLEKNSLGHCGKKNLFFSQHTATRRGGGDERRRDNQPWLGNRYTDILFEI